jgi:hypothetical protein
MTTLNDYLGSVQEIPGLEQCKIFFATPIGTEHDSETEYRASISISCVANDLDDSLEGVEPVIRDLINRSTQPLSWVKTKKEYCDLITPEHSGSRYSSDEEVLTRNPFSSKQECAQTIDKAIDDVQTALDGQFPHLAKPFAKLSDSSKFLVLMDQVSYGRPIAGIDISMLKYGIDQYSKDK